MTRQPRRRDNLRREKRQEIKGARMKKFKTLTSSLWFKLVGAFALVVMILTVAVLGIVSTVTEWEFDRYVAGRSAYVEAILPTIVSPRGRFFPHANRPFEIVSPTLEAQTTAEAQAEAEVTAVESFTVEIPAAEIIVAAPSPIFINPDFGPESLAEELGAALTPNVEEAASLAFLSDVRRRVGRAVFLAGFVAVTLSLVLARQITRPLTRVRHATQQLAEGNLGIRVPVTSTDEIGKVALAFNQMAAALEQQEQTRRQMVADVAHELRTPLTVMKSNLEAMLDGLIPPDTAELGELYDEVQRLTRLIEELRLLSLADAGQLTLRLEPVDVFDLLEATVTRLTPLAEAQGVQLPPPHRALPLSVQADSDKLQQAIGNLVDNALRHTPPGGRVMVTAVQEQKTAHISVSDTGPGIPPEDLPHLFDRFWRGDKSRSRHSGGSGLGLAIVQQIVMLHGGRITAVSPPGQGATFTISLPLSPSHLATASAGRLQSTA